MKWFHDFTKELKNSEFPVMLYGAGIYAQRLTELLEADGVSVEGYLVDRKYYSESSSLLGKNTYLLESFVAENECTIVIAFEECSIERENELRGMANVRQIYSKDFGRDVATFIKNFWKSGDEFYEKEKTVLEKLRDDLCDEVSKVHFDEYIKQRLTGCGRKVHSMNPEYFDSDIIEATRMTEAETFVDCGAFDGDTVLGFVNFLKRCGRSAYNKIYAFEIDPANIKQMCKNLNGLNNVELIEKGVTDHTGTFCFRSGGGASLASQLSDDGTSIEVTTIDEVIKDAEVTFLKMDIEGSELSALKGAEHVIRRCHPKLAICVYHREEDLVTIPQYIQSLNPAYKLYFRNYRDDAWGSIIYAL